MSAIHAYARNRISSLSNLKTWLSSGDIKADRVKGGTDYITKAGLKNSAAKICRPGSVLVVVRSGILKHTLPVSELLQEAAINQDIKCFDSGHDYLNSWLALALRAFSKDILALNREGTTVQSVKYDTLRDFQLPIPPLAEQKRIAEKLKKFFTEIEQCKDRIAKIPVLLKRFRQSVLAAACSGGLSVDWRESRDGVPGTSYLLRQIHERRLKTASSFKRREIIEDQYSAVEENDSDALPQDWSFTYLNKLAESFDYGTSSKSAEEGRIPVLRMGNVQGGGIDWGDLVYTSDADDRPRYF